MGHHSSSSRNCDKRFIIQQLSPMSVYKFTPSINLHFQSLVRASQLS